MPLALILPTIDIHCHKLSTLPRCAAPSPVRSGRTVSILLEGWLEQRVRLAVLELLFARSSLEAWLEV